MTIEYRNCTTNKEYEQVQALEMLVWKMSANEAITPHTMHVLSHTGGHVLGAFDGETMIGCTVAFATRDPERLWSHMAAVHPDYQNQGLGYELKQRQKAWAMATGYQRMSWTFDPLQRRNAHFNFSILGAEGQAYHEDFYGTMNDGINAGMPSDRLEVTWHFSTIPKLPVPEDAPSLIKLAENGKAIVQAAPDSQWFKVAIPYDIAALKADSTEIALTWRIAMRQVFKTAFATGYKLLDFRQDRAAKSAFYWLYRAI